MPGIQLKLPGMQRSKEIGLPIRKPQSLGKDVGKKEVMKIADKEIK